MSQKSSVMQLPQFVPKALTSDMALVSVALIVGAQPSAAHHSHAMYDSDTEVTLAGTITEYHWVNPHTWIYLEVEGEDGETREWVIEGGGPGTLTRRGWSGNTFQPGERVTARVHPILDGSSGALLGIVTKESGEEFDGN